ncbi:hypothetical protein ACFFMN_33860 [Planobispora siamensis]|uniref:Uncharacterized protein n=1 Tax=Planobispora siamensis TaxID=936338 RepID=A0A8J3SFI7_9ACTN|nr:hypothetical protein [Planobispora siamensis]GIH91962.1 hypothetical protein Psi01_25920 [Planobispora siamensis]
MRLVKVIETCSACPSQWDAWTDTGQYLYLRYRSGVGTVEAQPDPDTDTWTDEPPLIEFGEPSWDGDISLTDFLAAASLELAPDAEVRPM